MNIVKLLEVIANKTHHSVVLAELLQNQSEETRCAFINNNTKQLRQIISQPCEVIANRSDIVRVIK